VANITGPRFVYRSTDGGLHFTLTGTLPQKPDADSFYSIKVDPNDPTHLLTGLHEADGALESTDSGDTWHFVNGTGWPRGGKSWFIFFVNTGNAATTSKTWFAIAQDGGSGMITRDGGQTWAVSRGLEGLQHPHGNSQIFQQGNALYVAGIYGAGGNGVYRSTDLGQSFTRVTDGNFGTVWGSAKYVYAAWGWACSFCDDGAGMQVAPLPGGSDWKAVSPPARLNWGPNSVAITSDGRHTVYVGSMWATGLWRYIEP
jgi:hypothetical protein